ncbi:MAG TPA: ROK family protein, partial [Acidimicrobiales bacterium]|nr:ROK family protein [Acidimicrobiales bacterium]
LGRLGREAAAAGQAPRLVELAGGDPEHVRGEHVTAAVAEGDEPAVEVLGRFAWWVALGLANLANIFDPEAFVLGGGVMVAGEALLTPTREAFVGLVEGADRRPSIPVLAATLGERAGAIGAAYLAAEAAEAAEA